MKISKSTNKVCDSCELENSEGCASTVVEIIKKLLKEHGKDDSTVEVTICSTDEFDKEVQ